MDVSGRATGRSSRSDYRRHSREDTGLQVFGRPVARGLDPPKGEEQAETAALPEHEEDDRLPGEGGQRPRLKGDAPHAKLTLTQRNLFRRDRKPVSEGKGLRERRSALDALHDRPVRLELVENNDGELHQTVEGDGDADADDDEVVEVTVVGRVADVAIEVKVLQDAGRDRRQRPQNDVLAYAPLPGR